MSRSIHALRKIVTGLALVLVLGAHVAAASVAADCAYRCQHSCCRYARGGTGGAHGTGFAHCAHAHGDAASCSLRGRCEHGQEVAITGLPPLALASVTIVHQPVSRVLEALDPSPAVLDFSRAFEPPPPRLHS